MYKNTNDELLTISSNHDTRITLMTFHTPLYNITKPEEEQTKSDGYWTKYLG